MSSVPPTFITFSKPETFSDAMDPPLVTIITTLILVSQLPKSGCGRSEGGSGVPSIVGRDFTRVTNNRDSDYPVYRVVSRTRQPSDDQEKKDLGGERGVTQVMGGEPYTGGLEHRLAHVKKFGSFAGKRISDDENSNLQKRIIILYSDKSDQFRLLLLWPKSFQTIVRIAATSV